MADTFSARLTTHQQDCLQSMVERGEADNKSEAFRMALDSGLVELGYKNGHKTDTRLRYLLQRAGDAFGLLGLFWLGLTFLYPVGFRMWAIPIFAVALGLHVADRGLKRHEPGVSRRLAAVFGSENA